MKKLLYSLMVTAFFLNLYMAFESYNAYFPPYAANTCLTIDLRSFDLVYSDEKEPVNGWIAVLSNGKDSSTVILISSRSPDLVEKYEVPYSEFRNLDVKEVNCETGY